MTKRYVKTDIGILDTKKGTGEISYYQVGDTFVYYPEYDGRVIDTIEKNVELTNKGQVGKVLELLYPYIIIGEKGLKHKIMLAEIGGNKERFNLEFYRLGTKFKK